MTILIGALLIAGLAASLLWSLRPLSQSKAPVSEVSIEQFSADQYLPLEKLLSERDYQFLAAQPGYRPAMGRKLRRERRHICRGYLSDLTDDFNRLHAVAMQSAASSEGGEELVSALARQKLLFKRRILGIRLSLTLSALGLGRVNPVPAIEAFRALTILARNLTLSAN